MSILLFFLALIVGCYQGRPSEKPPIHLNPNMDNQSKYKAQSHNPFFANGATMRQPVAGTVARGYLREDDAFYRGVDAAGAFVKKAPLKLTAATLTRGQQRYNIYCTPCHGQVGDGKGIIVKRGLLPPPTFHDPRLRGESDGYFFNAITNGIRNMQAYRHQIPVQDRWAIVHYIRALQRSQNASLEDVPAAMHTALQTEGSP